MERIVVCRYVWVLLLMLISVGGQAEPKDSLRVTIFGDSYSTFEGYNYPATNETWYYAKGRKDNDVKKVEQTWWYQVARKKGWKVERVNAYSGSTVCRTGYKGEDYTERSFINRMSNLGEPDIILICAATNDSWANAPIGEYKYGEWTDKELYSFRPAMAKLCWGLRTHYPKARLLFILNSGLKPVINESVRTICHHYDVPLLLLHDIDKQAGHPSVKGMASIAEQVAEALSIPNN